MAALASAAESRFDRPRLDEGVAMDFYRLIMSLDELLYEVMGWLLYYPLTLWRTVRRPVAMIHYAEAEMAKPEAERFADTLSPPLFLFLTLVLLHLVELVVAGQSELVARTDGLSGLVQDDSTLLVLRIMLFALFPLLLARRTVVASGEPVDRETMRQPFYAQCFATSIFALLMGVASILVRVGTPTAIAVAGALVLVDLVWLLVVETLYFRARLGVGGWAAFSQAARVVVEGAAVLAVSGAVLA